MGVTRYYFDLSGDWIAFRRNDTDKYLFNKNGSWIGWFPWSDNDAVTPDGRYLGTVERDRLLRRTNPTYRGYPGYPPYPPYPAYPAYPPYARHLGYAPGYEDVPSDMLKG